MIQHFSFLQADLDMGALLTIAQRIVSVETVTDIERFAVKVHEAADIAIEAGLRIAGVQSRGLLDDEKAAQVRAVANEYQRQGLV